MISLFWRGGLVPLCLRSTNNLLQSEVSYGGLQIWEMFPMLATLFRSLSTKSCKSSGSNSFLFLEASSEGCKFPGQDGRCPSLQLEHQSITLSSRPSCKFGTCSSPSMKDTESCVCGKKVAFFQCRKDAVCIFCFTCDPINNLSIFLSPLSLLEIVDLVAHDKPHVFC